MNIRKNKMKNTKIKKIISLSIAASFGLLGIKQVVAQSFITSDLNVGFPLEAAVQDGAIRILIPTATDEANVANSSGTWNAGVPIINAFSAPTDSNMISVECPIGVPGFNFGTPTKQIGSIFYNPATQKEISQFEAIALAADSKPFIRYFAFTCPYTGPGDMGGQMTPDAYNIRIRGLINPAASPSAGIVTLNEAIMIPGKIQHLENGYTSGVATNYLVSDTNVIISGFMQDVLVTAKLESQLMFRIDPVPEATSACGGVLTTVPSTPLMIDYGAPSVGQFVDAAQQIFVLSSATNGYVVTMSQNQPMGRNGGACPADGLLSPTEINRDCIPNFGWQTGLTEDSGAPWSDPLTETGFGYTMTAVNSDLVSVGSKNRHEAAPFFGDGSAYSRLATRDNLLGSTPVKVGWSNSIGDGDIFDVCYRLAVDAQNNAGTYTNAVLYTITASF